MIRPWPDAALILYMAVFFAIEGVALLRETRLGWAMFVKCLAMASTFLYAYVLTFHPLPMELMAVIRVVACASLTMAVNQILFARTGWPWVWRALFCLTVLVACAALTHGLYALHGFPH